MEVLASAFFTAFSLPCLLLLLAGETGLRLATLTLRWEGCAWPTCSAFLGYRIGRTGHSSSSGGGGGVFQQDELLPPECLNRLAVAVYRRGGKGPDVAAVDYVFCLLRMQEGEEVRELRFHHVFHCGCLHSWLLRPRATCPLCRDRLLPSDPSRACSIVDEMYTHDYDLSSSSSSTAHVGTTLWHT